MRTGLCAGAGLLCLLLVASSPGFGQDFDQLLKAVDKLEASLQTRLDQESQKRQQAIEELRADVVTAQTSSVSKEEFDDLREQLAALMVRQSEPDGMAWRRRIQDELSDLRKQIEEMHSGKAASASGISDEELAALAADIAWLKAENTRLSELLVGGEQYVSTDGVPMPVADRQKVDRLTQRLTVLNEQLEQVIAHGNAQPAPARSNSVWDGLSLGGFVDASNYSDHNTSENSFGLDQVEVNIGQEFSPRARVQADIEYVNDGQGGFDLDLEQGYFTYSAGSARQWRFSFGKFNAPIGFEAVDPPDMYQYSGGLVGSYCIPGNLTGLLLATELGSGVDLAAYIVNGWDVNTDNNQDKTVGTRLGFSPFENLNFGLSAISGPEHDDNNSSRRTVFDIDLAYSLTDNWLWGGEFNHGTETGVLADNGDASWSGFLIMTNIGFAERWGITGRFDYLNDRDGVLTDLAQEWKAVTLSPSVELTDALGGLVEFRYDFSNREAFASDDSMKDSQFTTAVEFIYTF